ncbi:class I SAM-dependent methyltransferase [Rubrobacter indicoceani]|uniref:class I SAM-dependent methyltransferase n=1 Tax=Rubrobacter indicoceani TaxID=2051957 RepID=UPI000E5BF386|nr:class I SAM-dependent methyltransferase [Rubrobacter indicoceani]
MKPREAGGLFSRLYDPLVAPLERLGLGDLRRETLRGLRGEVLELGVGTGRNFPFYPPGVERVVGVEPDGKMMRRAPARVAGAAFPVELVEASAEELPFEDGSFDAVVATLVFCTIPDPERAVREVHRVLKDGGELRLLEHVRMEHRSAAWAQEKATPVWKQLAGGCHLDRDTLGLIENSRLSVERVERRLDGLVLSIVARKPPRP